MTAEEATTTWDGKPISPEPPFGATIIVRHRNVSGWRYLLLHRAAAGPDGDWAWTPPSGARLPSEAVDACAKRELLEETGLLMEPQPTDLGTDIWPVYLVETEREVQVSLSAEHDGTEWVSVEEAIARCRPERVAAPFRRITAQQHGPAGGGRPRE